MADVLRHPFVPVLGKRKLRNRLASPQLGKLLSNLSGGLCLVASDASSDDEYLSNRSSTEDEYESGSEHETLNQRTSQKPHAPSRVSSSSHLKGDSRKKYFCSYKDCTKSYTKPSRLVEHERSHTGEVRTNALHPHW